MFGTSWGIALKLLTYSEPGNEPQIGVLMEDGKTIAALQAGTVAMEGAPKPYFRDMLSLLREGPAATDKAQAVVEYVVGKRPDDVMAALDSVALLGPAALPGIDPRLHGFRGPHHQRDPHSWVGPARGIG